MKEILESKVMIGFAVFVLGFVFLTSWNEKNVQKNDLQTGNQTSQINNNLNN